MKRLIFILLGVIFTMPSMGQLVRQKEFFHDPKFKGMYLIDTVSVGDVKYERVRRNGRRLFIDNINNVMGSNDITLRDGTPLPRLLETYGHGEVYMAGLKRALSETFCNYKVENERMGAEKDYFSVCLVFSSDTGKVLEVSFSTTASNTLQSLPMSVWATLEQKIKDYVYTDLSDAEEAKQLSWLFTAILVRFPVTIIERKTNDRISAPITIYDGDLINP